MLFVGIYVVVRLIFVDFVLFCIALLFVCFLFVFCFYFCLCVCFVDVDVVRMDVYTVCMYLCI